MSVLNYIYSKSKLWVQTDHDNFGTLECISIHQPFIYDFLSFQIKAWLAIS